MDSSFIQEKRRRRETVDDHFDYQKYKIGEGTYGVVYKARRIDRPDQRDYALKKIKGTEAEGLSLSSCREISILRELQHENVVCIEEVYLNPFTRDVWLLFEYAEYDLYQILQYHRNKTSANRNHRQQPVLLGDRMVRSLMHQIFLGMQYLHDGWLLHRDLKPANILVMGNGPERGKVKIADLGMARLFNSPLKPLAEVDPVVVTIWYRAPELLLGTRHYTKAVDHWALGCIFAELMTTKPIFRGQQVEQDKNSKPPFQKDQLERIFQVMGLPNEKTWSGAALLPEAHRLREFKGNYGTGLEHCIKHTYQVGNQAYPESAFNLLHHILALDPAKRISCKQALEHEYFRHTVIDKDIFASVNTPYPTRSFDGKPKVQRQQEPRAGSAQPPPAMQGQLQSRGTMLQAPQFPYGQGDQGNKNGGDPGHAGGKLPHGPQRRVNGPGHRYGKNLGMPTHHY